MSEAPTNAQPIAQRLRSDAAANRERILAAATIAVRRDGEKVPMATIAEEAGVGIGTVYRHYPTRPALLAALTLRSFHLVLERARTAAQSDEPAPRPSHGSSNRRSRPATSSSSRSTAAPSSMTRRSSRSGPRSETSSSRSSPADAATGPSGQTPPRSTSSSPERCSPNHSRTQLTGTNSPAGKPESISPASLPPTHHSPARDHETHAKTNACAQQTSIDDRRAWTGRVGPVPQRAASAHASVRALASALLLRSGQSRSPQRRELAAPIRPCGGDASSPASGVPGAEAKSHRRRHDARRDLVGSDRPGALPRPALLRTGYVEFHVTGCMSGRWLC